MKIKLIRQNIFFTLLLNLSFSQFATVSLFHTVAFSYFENTSLLAQANLDFEEEIVTDRIIEQDRDERSSESIDIFDSKSNKITKTPYNQKWSSVKNVNLPMGAWSDLVKKHKNDAVYNKLKIVNEWVNQRITFKSDLDNYGVADEWVSATDLINKGSGDCEDYAIAKMQILAKMGLNKENMYLVVLKDLALAKDHAVLVIKNLDSIWVLDSLSNRVFLESQAIDYAPMFAFNFSSAYTFGKPTK